MPARLLVPSFKLPTNLHGIETLVATRPLLQQFDHNLLIQSFYEIGISDQDIGKYVELIPQPEQVAASGLTTLKVIEKLVIDHPVRGITLAALLNTYARLYDLEMASLTPAPPSQRREVEFIHM